MPDEQPTTDPPLLVPSARTARLRELATLFLRLGATAFGGPAAHIAMIEDEVVARRGWMTRDEFVDLLGATNLIPGPNSTEMAIHIGYRRAGFPGLIVAGVCFILPAVLIVSVLAHLYVRYGSLPEAAGALYAIKPVILGVVVQAIWRLAHAVIKGWLMAAVTILCAVAAVSGVHELLILLVAGIALPICRGVIRAPGVAAIALPPLTIAGAATAGPPGAASLTGIFLFFLKVGSVLFGSGYVLLAFLRADLVERWGWLTEAQLLDAVAVGQVTPGPVFTTATFIGYLLAGPAGAAVATIGIFLPAFFFVAASGPLIPRIRRSKVAGAVLDGVNAASLALMAVVSCELARAAIVDLPTILLAAASVALVLRFKINSAWLVLFGAVIGTLLGLVGLTPASS